MKIIEVKPIFFTIYRIVRVMRLFFQQWALDCQCYLIAIKSIIGNKTAACQAFTVDFY